MPRLACLYVPLFPLAARLRSEPDLMGGAVAVCEGNGSAARVVAAALMARQAGVRVGMTLAQARSVLPDLIARGRDPVCERSAHEALLEVGWRLSPRVEEAADNLVVADVGGMERLFEDEAHLGQSAIRAARSLDLRVRVGIAATKLAARIAARLPATPVVVREGDEARFLAPLPLGHLALDGRLLTTLRRWGIGTIGELAALPADRVASRLGLAGSEAHQAARGLDPRPLVPHQPSPALSEGLELEWPVVTVEPLLAAIRQSLERMHERLAQLDLACSMLELELGLEPEGVVRRAIRLPSPTRDVAAMLGLIRLELESDPPQAPVAAFLCTLHPAQPRRGQLTLFGPAEIHPERLATALARLAARLGPQCVGSPRAVDGHLPEGFASVSFDPPPAPKLRDRPRQGRGLLGVRVLRPPVGLEVIAEEGPAPASDGALGSDALRLVSMASISGATPRIQGLVRVAAGPWRLEEGWWSDQPVTRDYWDVELSSGGLYRIYRDPSSGEWFADGMYD